MADFTNIANLRGPKGDKGDDGLDGSNVLPTDEAMAQAAADPESAFATRLLTTVSDAVPPLVATAMAADESVAAALVAGAAAATQAAAADLSLVQSVRHGWNSTMPRPAGVGMVLWTGALRPVNMGPADFWIEDLAFSPSDFGAFHSLYWASGQQLDDGAPIDQITDLSGNGHHLTPYLAAAGRRPLYVGSHIPLSDRAAFHFDGVDDTMRTAAFTSLAQPWTVVTVMNAPKKGATARVFSTGGNVARLERTSAGAWQMYAGTGIFPPNAATRLADIGVHIGQFDNLGGVPNSLHRLNGSESALSLSGSAATISAFALGSNYDGTSPQEAYVGLFGIIPRKLTSAERADFEAGCRAYYGLAF